MRYNVKCFISIICLNGWARKVLVAISSLTRFVENLSKRCVRHCTWKKLLTRNVLLYYPLKFLRVNFLYYLLRCEMQNIFLFFFFLFTTCLLLIIFRQRYFQIIVFHDIFRLGNLFFSLFFILLDIFDLFLSLWFWLLQFNFFI